MGKLEPPRSAQPINHEINWYLRFWWNQKTFEYTCLAFGLNASPWVFTKLLRVAVTFLRRSGIRLVIYLDDLLIVWSSTEECWTSVALVIKILQSFSFLINFPKSETTPVQAREYIGLITNSVLMSFHLTKKKVDDIKRLSRETLKKKKCSLRELAKIIGNVNWATYAVKFAQSHFRALQAVYNSVTKNN